jgi:hypothetical protein
MTEKPLKIYSVNNFEMSVYNYFVVTPEGDYMYFEKKKQANEFIEFYKTYTDKKLVQA